ncbi:MAG: Uracil-DNA glycosylase, family 1 [Labilithrix sp.]|nr:Uracil-DNA glycosylase, family 1 [Labilithrix sp.]
MKLPPAWESALRAETDKPYFRALAAFLAEERASKTIFPAEHDVFRALALTPPEAVKVVLLGQDPYHDHGQAHGLCFSVLAPTPTPPSLRNVFRELHDDLGIVVPPGRGDLTRWAEQGVLLLNTVLTVVAHEASSHKKKGWETFTDAVIRTVNDVSPAPVVFCLWGNHARTKRTLVDAGRHVILESGHPSPLSARRFLGTRPFSKIDAALRAAGRAPIDWQL